MNCRGIFIGEDNVMRGGGNVTGGRGLNDNDYSWGAFGKGLLDILGAAGEASGAPPMLATICG